jgi:hypothetical protein
MSASRSKMGRALAVLALSTPFWLFTQAQAQTIQAKDGRFEAQVSADQMSRITILSDKIVSVRTINDPAVPQMLIEAEESTGDVYVAFDGDPEGRTYTAFLVTATGRTVQATLHAASLDGQTVKVSLPEASMGPAGSLAQRSDRRSGYTETVSALIRLMFNSQGADGVERSQSAQPPTRVGPYELAVVETYQVAGLKGQVLSIKNASDQSVPVLAESFLIAGVWAVASDRDELMPGASGRVFLVEEGR